MFASYLLEMKRTLTLYELLEDLSLHWIHPYHHDTQDVANKENVKIWNQMAHAHGTGTGIVT